jgi:hypothetical protein
MLAPAPTKGAWAQLRRITRRIAWIFVFVLASVAVLASALLLFLQTTAGRRWLAAKVSEFVSHELVADLRIERLDVISARRLVAARATLLDARGRPLLAVDGLEARFELVSLLEHIFLGPEIRVTVPDVMAEALEVGLYRDAHGELALVHAFESSTPSSSPSARPLRLRLPHIVVKKAKVQNDVPAFARANAEVGELTASLEVAPGLFALGLDSERLRIADALPVELRGALHSRIHIPGTTQASLAGTLGTLPVTARFEARGGELTLSATSPSLAPAAVRKLLPEWPLAAPIDAKAELSGRWNAFATRVEAGSGPSRVTGSGTVALDPPAGKLAFEARALDLRLLTPDGPASSLDTQGELEFSVQPEPRVEVTARSIEGELAARRVPKTSGQVVYTKRALTGSVAVLEPALPLEASYTLSPEGSFEFRVRAQELALAALAPYGVEAEGRANVDATGVLARGALDVRFDSGVRGLHVASVEAHTLTLRGAVAGALVRPRNLAVDVRARGTNVTLGRAQVSSLELASKGTLGQQRLTARGVSSDHPAWSASASVAFGSAVVVSEAHAAAALDGASAELDVAEARVGARRVDVRGVRLSLGDGIVSGSGSWSPEQKRVELVVSDFDPAPLTPLLGVEHDAFGGRFDARLSFEEDVHGRRGSFSGSLEQGVIGSLTPVFGDFTGTFQNSELEAHGAIAVAGVGRTKVRGHATFPERPLSSEALGAATGELSLDVSELDLAALAHRFAPSASLSGRAEGGVWLARKQAFQPIEAGYTFDVHELTLGEAAHEKPLLRVDLSSQGTLDTAASHLDLEVKDDDGIWIKTRAELLRSGSRELELLAAGRTDELLAAPFRAELVVLPRRLARFGGVARQLPQGDLSGGLSVKGTLGRPKLDGRLTVARLSVPGIDARSEIAAGFEYSAEDEEYAVNVLATGSGVRKLDFTGEGHCGWFDRGGFGRDFSLRSSGRADHVALAPLGDVLGVKLGGEASGQGSLTASASSFEAAGRFDVRGLALERRALGDGSGSLSVHQGLARAELQLGDARAKLRVSGELGLDWSAGAPRIDPRRGGSVEAEVRNYELEMLAPLLRAFASEVSGPINGFVSLVWSPEDQKGKRTTKLRANASVSGGRLRLTRGTGSIRNAELRAIADGHGTLHITFSGSARAKEPDVEAKADVIWDGPLPRRVDAELRAQRFPVSYEGVLLGTATVDKKARPIRVGVDLASAEQRVDVSVPALEFELPTKEDTRLIDLAPDPTIHVTDSLAPPEVATGSDAANTLLVSVTLGDGVRVKQPDLLVPVTGKLTRDVDGRLDGSLLLPEGGTVSAFGQVFRLKSSSVRFAKQPPERGVLSIQASARTVEGIVVDLDVSGTVSKPVVRFRSDPPRSEGEIISLLLGIRPDDSSSVPGQQDVGGSAMALAMNQLLRNSPLAGFQFGETQSRTGDTISTVSFRAGNTVWLEGWSTRQNQGTPYEATRSSGVVDWRFAPGFSMRTQLGYPSGLELRWSHRY